MAAEKKAASKGQKTAAQKSKNTSTTVAKPKAARNKSIKLGLRWFLLTTFKLAIAFVFLIGAYSIYLDGKIRNVFEGQRWQVPAQIYGRVLALTPGTPIRLNQLKQELQLTGYKKVAAPSQPGEFAIGESRAIIYQRRFDYGDGFSPAKLLTIDVNNNRISKLTNHQNQQINQARLEPLLMARMTSGSDEDRVLIGREQVPEILLDTLILVEDRNFYHHYGVSLLGIARAALSNLAAGRVVQGGSTLTQQLAKNMFLSREKTIWRKVKEALIAVILELRYSKDQILEAYINEVYLGQHYASGIYGFGLGAKFYFDRELSQLSNAEMALLIGQIKGPSYYDPWRYPERALERRDLVLRMMFEQHLINRNEFELALNSPIAVRQQRRFARQSYPAYLQLVKSELKEKVDSYAMQSGIKVFTGFDIIAQQNIEAALNQKLTALETKEDTDNLQAAVVITDIHSGEIRALIGDRDARFAGFNRALNAKRQIGSLLKPAIYLAALERYQKFNFGTLLADQPVSLTNENGKVWQPKNYDDKFRGDVLLIDGLVNSYNVPTVNLGMTLGLDTVAKTVQTLGFNQDIELNPSFLLGAINMSPLEVSQWYLTLAKQGSYQNSHAIAKVLSNQGETLWQFNQQPNARLSSQGAYLINHALTQVSQRGTAKSLAKAFPEMSLAGKTGTSNDLRDSWFVGYDQRLLVTTWLGRDDNKPMGLSGSSGALTVFQRFMQKQGVVSRHIETPPGIDEFLFELETGNVVTQNCLGTTQYPAVRDGIKVTEQCLKEKERSLLERIFGQ
jgi:penicillin-binding protein 1B